MPDAPQVREGDLAFAANVQTIWDVLEGRYDVALKLTRHSHATVPTVTMANRTEGGPILVFLDHTLDVNNPTLVINSSGIETARVNEYLDFSYLGVAPAAPGLGANRLRMYVRTGNLYFKANDSVEQQIPIGAPPGPSKRREFWYSGGG